MIKKLFIIISLLFSHAIISVSAETVVIRYAQTGSRYEYQINLLKMILDKAKNPEDEYILESIDVEATKGRLLHMFRDNRFDVLWMASTDEREEEFLPVKIPVLKGILGCRVFLIRKDSADMFSDIKTLDELTDKFDAGFGSHWADRKILEYNRIPMTHTPLYENLFKMLSAGRFDYFPRGIDEAWLEVFERKDKLPDIEVEKTLGFYYPYPYYYFLHPNKLNLSEIIYKGLDISKKDGSFDKLFNDYFGEYIRKSNFKNRRIFILKNPQISNIGITEKYDWIITP